MKNKNLSINSFSHTVKTFFKQGKRVNMIFSH